MATQWLASRTGTRCFIAVIPLLFICNHTFADGPLSCTLGVLQDLGWIITETTNTPGTSNLQACDSETAALFTYNNSSENRANILDRATTALHSKTTKCLVNQQYKAATRRAIDKLTANTGFEFLPVGPDPRDPFLPPGASWIPSTKRGYDIPATNITSGINALYKEPFVAECSAAVQIAQLAVLTEHYGPFTDVMLNPLDVGIGIWNEYAKNPSISGKKPLLLASKHRKNGLRELARLGKGAFYGQTGYIRSDRNLEFIDSLDNLGQNFLIVDLTDRAVEALRNRKRPLKELSKISRRVWKDYYIKSFGDVDIKTLATQMEAELELIDPFFSDIDIYVHPLKVKNFAFHIARQFTYNPRTPFVFEIYEDFQSGYFHSRYVDYRLNQCLQQSYCRKIDRRHYTLTDALGVPGNRVFTSSHECEASIESAEASSETQRPSW